MWYFFMAVYQRAQMMACKTIKIYIFFWTKNLPMSVVQRQKSVKYNNDFLVFHSRLNCHPADETLLHIFKIHWNLHEVSHLGQEKLVNYNQIPDRIADENWIAKFHMEETEASTWTFLYSIKSTVCWSLNKHHHKVPSPFKRFTTLWFLGCSAAITFQRQKLRVYFQLHVSGK